MIQDENLNVFLKVQTGKTERIATPNHSLIKQQSRSRSNFNEYASVDQVEANLGHLILREKNEIIEIIGRHENVSAKNKFDVGAVRNHEARIRLTEYRYVSKKPYRCSIPDQREIESQITKLLDARLIEESSSPFGAPVTLAYKKEDGRKTRLCIDFRELNKLVVPEAQPFPRIEDIMVKAGNCK